MYRILTDSTSSIPAAWREELGIDVVSLHVNRSGEEYIESEMDLDAFYEDIYGMIDDIPTSSLPSPATIYQRLAEAAEAGDSVLGIFLSSRMSGTFEAAVNMAAQVKEAFPQFTYAMFDALTNSMEEGWPVVAAAKARQAGAAFEEAIEQVKQTLNSTRFVFAPETLRFLEKGGRIGHAAALLGGLLNICPILTVKDGFATTAGKARTQKKALAHIVDTFKHDIENCGLKNVVVHYIGSRVPAEQWAKEVIEPLVGREVLVSPVSPVIGVHVGPAMGLAYECLQAIPGKHAEPGPTMVAAL